jgi:hypothetical protein
MLCEDIVLVEVSVEGILVKILIKLLRGEQCLHSILEDVKGGGKEDGGRKITRRKYAKTEKVELN